MLIFLIVNVTYLSRCVHAHTSSVLCRLDWLGQALTGMFASSSSSSLSEWSLLLSKSGRRGNFELWVTLFSLFHTVKPNITADCGQNNDRRSKKSCMQLSMLMTENRNDDWINKWASDGKVYGPVRIRYLTSLSRRSCDSFHCCQTEERS